jgi:hypothetical protein
MSSFATITILIGIKTHSSPGVVGEDRILQAQIKARDLGAPRSISNGVVYRSDG